MITIEINMFIVAIIFIRSSNKGHLYRYEIVSQLAHWSRTLERPFQVLRNKWEGIFSISFEMYLLKNNNPKRFYFNVPQDRKENE